MSAGRTALVTGGSGAIGSAIARSLASAGHPVAFTYHSREEAAGKLRAQLEELGQATLALPCDVTDWQAVDEVFAQVEGSLGPVAIVVNAAGVVEDRLLPVVTKEQWDRNIDVNLGGAAATTRRAARGFLRQRWGRVVNVGSVSARLGVSGQAAYAASKAGLEGLTRTTARELAARNVTCNLVVAGPVGGGMLGGLLPERLAEIRERVPLGRLGAPEDVAAMVAFLCGEEAAFITGAVIPVDGGLSMGA